ncbi:MAG: replicative DNA helicase [Deltaproteobacteria bacterium]|nr:replicative DNA helicase [Deltaproteobacteria bacterium]
MDSERRQLRNLDAERSVLGGLMLDDGRFDEVADFLKPEDFQRDTHGRLYALLIEMRRTGKPIEMLSVVNEIDRTGSAEDYGGLGYVSDLPGQVASTQNIAYYAKVVRDLAIERRLVEAARGIESAVYGGEHALHELLSLAMQNVQEVENAQESKDWRQISSVIDTEITRLQNLKPSDGFVTGISTGFIDLDKMLSGFHKTDLLILAARPAMGKTAFALNLCRNVAQQGHGVGIFSLEMGAEQLVTRMLVSQARVSASKVRRGQLDLTDWDRLIDASNQLYHLQVHIDDTPGINILQLSAKARRLKKRCPSLALIVVDYIGLMNGEPGVSRQEQVAASSRGLKGLAKELNITVIALSQLNRAVENRTPQIPIMADLRESGSIEQDADIIMFIYREEYYNKENPSRPGEADIIIAKHRNGETGIVPLSFQGELTLFGNLARNTEGYL